jgi:predicted Ser/Thr protein kinase
MAAPLEPGDPRRLGDYDVLGRLGEGGQGTVYLCTGSDGVRVAIKVLKGHTDPATQRRLARELEAVKRVAPFCTAQVIEFEDRFIVSEFVNGPSLQDRVQQDGPISGSDLIRLAIGTASALAAIHDAGVVHRDFKPANVLLGPDGPRVVDFGIARQIDAGSSMTGAMGTPGYIAPEQLRGEAVTPASDLFSWAATIVFAATGRHPFGADTVALIYQRILAHDPDVSAVPDTIRPMVAACLAKDPADRPVARDLMVSLVSPQGAAGQGPTTGPRPPLQPDAPRPQTQPIQPLAVAFRRRRQAKIAAVSLLAALLAGLVALAFAFWPTGGDTRTAAKPTQSQASVTPSAIPTGVPEAYVGTWTGTVKNQTDSAAAPTNITLTLRPGRTKSTWQAGGCTQDVVFQSAKIDSLTLQHMEIPGQCGGGVITASLKGSTLSYSWTANDKTSTYAGDLTKG